MEQKTTERLRTILRILGTVPTHYQKVNNSHIWKERVYERMLTCTKWATSQLGCGWERAPRPDYIRTILARLTRLQRGRCCVQPFIFGRYDHTRRKEMDKPRERF